MKVILKIVPALMSVAVLFTEVPAQTDHTKKNLPVSINDLRNAPTEIVLDGRSLTLSTYLWRNFAPGISSLDNRGLMVALKVTTSDKQAFPSGVRLDRAWVLFGEQIWEIPPFRGRVQGSPKKEGWIKCSGSPVCEVPSAQGGPMWSPGVLVDVVLRIIDKEGRHHLIQAPRQYINAVS